MFTFCRKLRERREAMPPVGARLSVDGDDDGAEEIEEGEEQLWLRSCWLCSHWLAAESLAPIKQRGRQAVTTCD